MITAILLAAGYSRRFKKDKLMMKLNGRPVIEHTLSAVSRCSFTEKLLIQRNDAYTALARNYGFRMIENHDAMFGQSASIHLGVKNAPSGSALMFFTADQPGISEQLIRRLQEVYAKNPDCIIVPRINGQNKSPTIFPSCFAAALLQTEGDMGGRFVISKYPNRVKYVSFSDEIPFRDIDTAEDFDRILEHLSGS